MDISKHRLIVDGLKLTYYQTGHGPTLLFLHGGRVRAMTFKSAIRLLGTKYTVIAPDIPGFGRSQTPHEVWSFTDYTRFFNDFLQQLDLEKVNVMGYSMGGGIALHLAAGNRRVRKLVLVDSPGKINPSTERNRYDRRRLLFYLTHPKYFGSLIVLMRDYGWFLLRHLKNYRRMAHIRRACAQTIPEPTIRRLTMPVVLVWGRDDWIYPLETAKQLQATLPQSTLKVVAGNHDWLLYDPLQLKKIML